MLNWRTSGHERAEHGFDGGSGLHMSTTVTIGAGSRFEVAAVMETVRHDGGLVRDYVGSRVTVRAPNAGVGEVELRGDWRDLELLAHKLSQHAGFMRHRDRDADLGGQAAAQRRS